MFGFPEELSSWTPHHWLRIFTIIIVYLTVRPLLQKMYTRLGERQREREKRRYDDEQIRKHKQERIREKLGIVSADGDKDAESDEAASATAIEAVSSTAASRKRAAQPKQNKTKKDQVAAAVDSDEDVSDLLS